MSKRKQFDNEYKMQALQLAEELGGSKAAKELGISKNTLYTWIRKAKKGYTAAPDGMIDSKSLREELIKLREEVKEQQKEIDRLKKTNEFLEEASAFFAASRLK